MGILVYLFFTAIYIYFNMRIQKWITTCKTIRFFFTDKNEIIDEKFIDGRFLFMNRSQRNGRVNTNKNKKKLLNAVVIFIFYSQNKLSPCMKNFDPESRSVRRVEQLIFLPICEILPQISLVTGKPA